MALLTFLCQVRQGLGEQVHGHRHSAAVWNLGVCADADRANAVRASQCEARSVDLLQECVALFVARLQICVKINVKANNSI